MPVLPPRDNDDPLSRIDKSIRQGNWSEAIELLAHIETAELPMTTEFLDRYRLRLRRTLVSARLARSELAISLARTRAAAVFSNARHGFGDSANS
jgi:hypothetical protein